MPLAACPRAPPAGPRSDNGRLAAAVAALAGRQPLAEPPAAALAAEACRQAWRPERLRLLLLAESHMATSAAELACRVALPPGLDWPGPTGFVRHVYCAGYGEPGLLQPPVVPGNRGTPQFWRLLCAAEDAAMPAWPGIAGVRADGERLRAKAALLHRLRRRGIWLTDASLVALAAPGAWRARAAEQRATLLESWRLYHAALLPQLDPAWVVVIGHGVAGVLRRELDAAFPGRWSRVPQPNGARRPAQAAGLLAEVAARCARFAPESKD